MQRYQFEIKGISPLLIYGFPADFGENQKIEVKKKGKSNYGTPREQALKCCSFDEKTKLVWVPSTWITGTLRGVASDYKMPGSRKTLKAILGGVVFLEEEKLYFTKPIKTKDLEIDSRPVVIQRARIMRHRARVDVPWRLKGALSLDESFIDNDTLLEMLNDAGKRCGVGAFRPQCSGPFGRFQVSSWRELKK